jgi:D-serine deaminase-like pyridoxal phosphate-dependent protein
MQVLNGEKSPQILAPAGSRCPYAVLRSAPGQTLAPERNPMKAIQDLETPALLLDEPKLERNIARMRDHLARLGAALRPHVKTSKSIDVVKRALVGQPGGITVSTLKEAEYFHGQGIKDILYAVGIAPTKLPHVIRLIKSGLNLTIVLDNVAAAQAVGKAAAESGVTIPVLIELDVDDHRSGIKPSSDLLLEVGRTLASSKGVELRGVITHAGESYNCRSDEALHAMAERERAGAVLAAERLRKAGLPAPVVSVGSTPTALFAKDLTGVTEVRAGVYMFFDLVMHGINVCKLDDIAVSVLVSVIGHQPEKGWVITDGGWMSMSRDRGTSSQPVDQGYGIVRDVAGGALRDDLIVVAANQEHGTIARRDGKPLDPEDYPVGTLLRVLPNHACATSAQHDRYNVVAGGKPEILKVWPRINGWS